MSWLPPSNSNGYDLYATETKMKIQQHALREDVPGGVALREDVLGGVAHCWYKDIREAIQVDISN